MPYQLKKLRRYKEKLRTVAKQWASQKQLLDIEQKGEFLSAFLAPVVGAVLGSILKQ